MKFAKKIISLAIVGIMIISVVGCNNAEDNAKNDNSIADNKESGKDNENVKLILQDAGVLYAEKLFDTSYVHTIYIDITEEDWEDLKENPLDKTKYVADVTIDGETVQNVSFATKGNTSLTSVASDPDSDRYSFKINFGKYEENQTYYGLDKLNLNNLYADATYMKDYLSYEIFKEAGLDAPLTSYVFVYINGEEFGLYIAIEEIGESYLQRTNDSVGELYKPETERLDNMAEGGNNGGFGNNGFNREDFQNDVMPDRNKMPEMYGEMPDMNEIFQNGERPNMSDMEGMKDFEWNNFGGMGSFGNNNNGAALIYTDDNIDSYSDIFNNAETDVTEEDMQRVIEALKGLSEGEDLESYLDTDAIIRYFVAHNFVMNYDGYTGNMLHNYYLYENNGKLSMLPWDYNLAFGAFSMNRQGQDTGATSLINCGIDSPLSGATEDSRPMWAWINSNEEYVEKYHECYNELITNYFESGEFEKEIDRVYEMILPYVDKDVTAFYSVDEFKTGYETLKEFCLLRAESIRKQLDGELATVLAEQEVDKQVDASLINIQDMGKQNMNKGNIGGEHLNGNMNWNDAH